MSILRSAVVASGTACALALMAWPAAAQTALDEGASALLAEFASTSAPLLPTVLDWSDPGHRAMIEGLFSAAEMRADDRAALGEMLAGADGAGQGLLARERVVSANDLSEEGNDYWIGPVTSVFDIEDAADTLAVNAVVSLAAPPARCFGLLALSPDDGFSRIETVVVQRQFSCADLQLRVESAAVPAEARDEEGGPAAIVLSAAQYPDGDVQFLASGTSATSSGGFDATSAWPPQDPPGALIKVCVYRQDSDCSYAFDRGQSLDFKIEGDAVLKAAEERFVPDFRVGMHALVQRVAGGGCYMFDETRDSDSGLRVDYGEDDRRIGWFVDNIEMFNPDNCLGNENAVHYYFSLQVETRGHPLSGVQHIYIATPHYLSTTPDLLLPEMTVAWGCLAAGSLVTMADGSLRAIEEIAAGERVLSGAHAVTVTELTTGVEPHPMVVLVAEDGGRLSMTRDHPVPVGGTVLRADAVAPGMVLGGAGGPVTVAAVEVGETMVEIFNLKLGTPEERARLGEDGLTFLANGMSVGDLHMQTALGRAGQAPVVLSANEAD